MRLDQQNRRSCIGLMVILALLAGLVVWASLGGVPGETVADDVQAGVGVPPGSPGTNPPAHETKPVTSGDRGQ